MARVSPFASPFARQGSAYSGGGSRVSTHSRLARRSPDVVPQRLCEVVPYKRGRGPRSRSCAPPDVTRPKSRSISPPLPFSRRPQEDYRSRSIGGADRSLENVSRSFSCTEIDVGLTGAGLSPARSPRSGLLSPRPQIPRLPDSRLQDHHQEICQALERLISRSGLNEKCQTVEVLTSRSHPEVASDGGDSNTIGFKGEGRRGLFPYGQELAEALRTVGFPTEVTSCGLCGFTSEELANEIHAPLIRSRIGPSGVGLAHLLREGEYDLVLIMVGTNDLAKSNVQMVTQGFLTLHKACHALGIPTVNIAPPSANHTSLVYETNNAKELRRKIRENRKRLVDSMSTWARSCPNVLLSLDCETLVPKNVGQFWEPDEIHLSVMGSRELGKKLAAQLGTVLQQLQSPQVPVQVQPVVRSQSCQHQEQQLQSPQVPVQVHPAARSQCQHQETSGLTHFVFASPSKDFRWTPCKTPPNGSAAGQAIPSIVLQNIQPQVSWAATQGSPRRIFAPCGHTAIGTIPGLLPQKMVPLAMCIG